MPHFMILIYLVISSCGNDDDNSTTVAAVSGCTDPLSQNYNPEASVDDGSCIYDLSALCDDADFIFGNGSTTLNGADTGIQPGDIIGIEAGTYERIIFQDITGTPENPVIIINCGGKVTVGGPNANNGILIQNSSHIRVTGTGHAGESYGIFIAGSRDGTQGIVAARFSTAVEIDHVEIQRTGFAGIMVKTDPSCDPATSAERGGPDKIANSDFLMRDVNIHDNYIHDVSGEGIYIGNSFYNGTTVYGCGVTQYPHEVRGVRVSHNRVENAGWEAIQVGAAVEDVRIYENIVVNYGTERRQGQDGGIQVGVGTTGEVFNNLINGGIGPGIFIQGIGDNLVYNNVIRNAGTFGIIISTRPTPLSSDVVGEGFLGGVHIINNTIIESGMEALRESVNEAPGNVFLNNLLVSQQNDWDNFRGDSDWERDGNVVFSTAEAANFLDPENLNFGLTSDSDAVDAGIDVSEFGITLDFEGNTRPNGSGFDVGAYESQ